MCIVYVLANSCGQVEIAMLIYLWVNLGGNLSGTTTTLAIAAKNYYTDFLLYNSIIPLSKATSKILVRFFCNSQ